MIRTTRPTSGNKYFITKGAGGYSTCIKGKPTDSQCDTLANCVGYANGAANEEMNLGYEKYHLNCNAENFIERAIASGLSVYSKPFVGAIICWQKGATLSGNDGAGHVGMVVEVINDNCIRIAQSGYGSSTPFWVATHYNNNGRWGLNSDYKVRGFIEIPTYPYAPIDPFPGVSNEELAKRVWTGEFGNGDTRKAKLGIRYDAVQALVNKGYGKPEESKPTPAPTPAPSQKTEDDLLTLVKKTIRGDFGNGSERKTKLGSNYSRVQRQVNENIKHKTTQWDNIKLY